MDTILAYDASGQVTEVLQEEHFEAQVERHSSQDALLAQVPSCAVCIVAFGRASAIDLRFLEKARSSTGFGPILVVAPLSIAAVRTLAEFDPGLGSVIWLKEARSRLANRIRDECSKNVVARFLEWLERHPEVAPIIASVIKRAAVARPPPTTVLDLAHRVGIPESTLRYHWSRSLTFSPKQFLRWLLVLSAVEQEERDPESAAAWLGVDPRTVRSAMIDLIGSSAPAPIRKAVRVAFLEWAREHLMM